MIDLSSLFKRAWALFAAKPVEHIVGGLLVAIISVLTIGILSGPMFVGYLRMIDHQRKGQPIALGEVFNGFDAFGSSFVASFCLVVGTCIGLILCVAPGLVVLAAWNFSLWFVALRGKDGFAALGASWQLLRAHPADVLLVLLLSIVIQSAGSAVVLGVLFAFPFSILLSTEAFEDLTQAPAPTQAAAA